MRILAGVSLVSALVLLFQVTLTRLFSIAQFYHFAFLVVSLALLGFGASGSLLAVWPRLRAAAWQPVHTLGFALTTVGAYLVLNEWPFDSYAIAWDREQVWRLLANLISLAVPFVFAGMLIGGLLSDTRYAAHHIYGANMIGSAVGAVIAPLLLARFGDARIILLCAGLGAGSTLLFLPRTRLGGVVAAVCAVIAVGCAALMMVPPDALEITPSPYKALSYFRHNPDASLEPPRYNAYSRLDIVRSPSIHSAPGLSMTFFGSPPPEIGLLIDGDNLLPVPQAEAVTGTFARSMPASVAFSLYESPDVLVLRAGGGLDVHVALHNGAAFVTAVEPNNLVIEALTGRLRDWAGLAGNPRVELVHQEIRPYARDTNRRFDIVQLALADAYRPVTSGAFTLTENYTLTVEAFRSYLDLLDTNGTFVVMRWLQSPPSEELRTLALIIEALEAEGGDPARQIVAFRTFQIAAFLVKESPFSAAEVETILARAADLKLDMLLAPNLPEDTVNRYARLPEPVYHTTFMDLLQAGDRETFYAEYDFEVSPPTDNHPFFFHYFKWRQTPDILDNLGRTWQPFGGSGYFVLVALLVFALVMAALFIILPVSLRPRFRLALRTARIRQSAAVILYFGSLGLAYLLVEVVAIQQFVLVLGQPTLAISIVLATLLLFSGIGSALSTRLPWAITLAALVGLAVVWPLLVRGLIGPLLSVPLAARLLLTVLMLAPLGFLMGVPFSRGVLAIRDQPDLIPWAWAINGGASVVSGILASLLALSTGFTVVLWIGAACYGVAWLTRPAPPRA